MKLIGFRRTGLVYKPISYFGWLLVILATIYSIFTFIQIDSHSHSVSDTLMNFVFNLIIIFIIYSLLSFLFSLIFKNK